MPRNETMAVSTSDSMEKRHSGPALLSGDTAAIGPEFLAARLAREMAERWLQGERLGAEELLNRHPELWKEPEATAQLIYEEICLRQDYGEQNAAAEVV